MEDIIFKSVRDKKLWNDVIGKEIAFYSKSIPNQDHLGLGIMAQLRTKEDRASLLQLQWSLYKV